MNILELYSIDGSKLKKGNLIDGNGYIFRYNEVGKKTSRQEFQKGKLHGDVIVYYKDEKVKSKYLYNEGEFIKELK